MSKYIRKRKERMINHALGRLDSAYTEDSGLYLHLRDALVKKLSLSEVSDLVAFIDASRLIKKRVSA